MNAKELRKKEAKKELKRWLKKGDTVYTVLEHVSKSGMSRNITFFTIKGNKPVYLTHSISQLLGYPMARNHNRGLTVTGCGMDMGFDVVYNLSCALFPNKERSGYDLTHRWL